MICIACEQGNYSCADSLIRYCAEINLVDKHNISPLRIICINGHVYTIINT